jgi:AhpD family alkylhydroperoxidase
LQKLNLSAGRHHVKIGTSINNKEEMMFENVEQIRKLRKKYNAQMLQTGISTFRELEDLEANALRDGELARKHKELIALGISISHTCYGWIEYHVSSAADLGASRNEILEATAVALALGGGQVHWATRFVFKVLEDVGHTSGGE